MATHTCCLYDFLISDFNKKIYIVSMLQSWKHKIFLIYLKDKKSNSLRNIKIGFVMNVI